VRLRLPPNPDELAKRLQELHQERRDLKRKRKQEKQKDRRPLNAEERKVVLEKTNGHCHLCGGTMSENAEGELVEERKPVGDPIKPVFDHIVPYATGGTNDLNNFLAAHGLCNGARWFYSPEEFQWILRMGVWARSQMERETDIGSKMLPWFWANEDAVERRRKSRYEDQEAATDGPSS
jgi:5-methylcytosine-specific restriction endonuclease McrA